MTFCARRCPRSAHYQPDSALLSTIYSMLSQKGSVNGVRVQHEDIAGGVGRRGCISCHLEKALPTAVSGCGIYSDLGF